MLSSQVLKVALLSERHVSDYTWFVDVILKLIRSAGDYVPDEVCVCQYCVSTYLSLT